MFPKREGVVLARDLSPDSIAEAAIPLLRDSHLADQLGQLGRERVEASIAPKVQASEIMNSHITSLLDGMANGLSSITPAPNTLAAIVDPDRDEFLPIGELGELVVNGPQVTKGYWDNPTATRECEAIIDKVRWWRTGDLAKMDENGYFSFYDRKRDLIKYKGLRVYAREVEEVLKTHPQIKEVGVIGVPNIKVGENVKAMVLLEGDARGTLSETEIIEYCQGKLTPYKIPKIIEFVGEIPKTDIGKVSRRELREEED